MNLRPVARTLGGCLLAFALASCGENARDTTPPTVSSTYPANGATGVLVNSQITVLFSEPMDPSVSTSITLAPSAGGTPVMLIEMPSSLLPPPGGFSSSVALAASVRLAENTSYTATISTAAKDAAGNALTVPYTWTFTTADSPDVWGTAQMIETVPGFAMQPQIAFDANGNAIAVWGQSSDRAPFFISRIDIWANRFSAASGTWGTAQLIETDNVGSARAPQVALDANGNALAVWVQFDGTRNNIWANRFSAASGTWGAAQLIETESGNADAPQITLDADGNAIAVWDQSDGTRSNIWANHFSAAGNTWGTAQLIEAESGNARAPQVALDANGNAIAVWAQSDGTRNNIWANRFSAASGTWETAQVIETEPGNAGAPQVALDASGNAIAVWEQFDAGRSDIWANRFNAANGTWGTAQLIETGNTGPAMFPQIALDASGNAIAVWEQFTGTSADIWANRFSAATGTWGTAQLIETEPGNASEPQIAFDASGNAIAVWTQFDTTATAMSSIWALRFSAASGTWGTPLLLGTDADGPQIAIDPSGNAIAIWSQLDGFNRNIWANRFQ